MAGEKGGTAEVYLQWVSFGDGKPAVVKSLPIKEVNDQKLGNASIAIGGEDDKENETTIFISSYDIDEDKDISLLRQGHQPQELTPWRRRRPRAKEQAKAVRQTAPAGKGEAPGIED